MPGVESDWGMLLQKLSQSRPLTFMEFRAHDRTIQKRVREIMWKRLAGPAKIKGAPPERLFRPVCTERLTNPVVAEGWSEWPAMMKKWKREKDAQRAVSTKIFSQFVYDMEKKEEEAKALEEERVAAMKMKMRQEKLREENNKDPREVMEEAMKKVKRREKIQALESSPHYITTHRYKNTDAEAMAHIRHCQELAQHRVHC